MGIKPKIFTLDLDDADADGIALSQTPGGAGDLTLAGALVTNGVATLDFGRKISITSSGDDSGVTFTVVGTDPDGHALTKTVTGPNSTTVLVDDYFATVTIVTISGAGTGNITVGTSNSALSKTIPLDNFEEASAAIQAAVTGTIDYTIEETLGPVQDLANPPQQSASWIAITGLSALAIDALASATQGATAFRIKVNSYSSGAELAVTMSQAYSSVN